MKKSRTWPYVLLLSTLLLMSPLLEAAYVKQSIPQITITLEATEINMAEQAIQNETFYAFENITRIK